MKDVVLPDRPVGQQLAYYLERIASGGEGASESDRERFDPDRTGRTDPTTSEGWRWLKEQIGEFRLTSVEDEDEYRLTATLAGAGDKRWRLSFEVAETPPHRIGRIVLERAHGSEVSVREASEADAAILADIERRCPIELGDRSITFDRGDDYFAFARLMEDVVVGLASFEGTPAAINCGALHSVRIGGVERRVRSAIHTRVLPEHQRKGLAGAVGQVFREKYPEGSSDCSSAYVSVDNAAMQKGFKYMSDIWQTRALRCLLDCASLSGPPTGRPAVPNDAVRISEILNSCHDAEEYFLPYTTEFLTSRLERAPQQYTWGHVRLTDNAVAGVWPAGESITVAIESGGERRESRRGLVLDYGFRPGGDAELEALLRSWCRELADLDFDSLSIFTSERSPGYELLHGLAYQIDAFHFWTPGLPPPRGHAARGLYTDQVYF